MQEKTTVVGTTFEEDIFQGLTNFPKYLPSKYFYDKRGDQIFRQIMDMPEYYLTDCEFDILENYKSEITDWFTTGTDSFNLIELGAGDGKKTKILLKYFLEKKLDFQYLPIDISQNALDQLEISIKQELPKVKVRPIQGTYFKALNTNDNNRGTRNIILFLGSNIGNMKHREAIGFLRRVQKHMNPNDLLFIGFDQKKDPQIILNAYNDATGITETFNKNILTRINRELEGDFDLDRFFHWEIYDPETATAKSFLVSKDVQKVYIGKLDLLLHFKKWETIHTETSQKYDDDIVKWFADEAKLRIKAQFTDSGNLYKNYLFEKVEDITFTHLPSH